MLLLNKLKKSIDEEQFLLMLQENQGLHSVTLKFVKKFMGRTSNEREA